jgi:cephalosporin-C deacetylase-like acetyl esterase
MLTRRAFGAALGFAVAARPAETLDVGGDFRGELDRYLRLLARNQLTARATKIAGIDNAAEVRERQAFVRRWMLDAIGGLPDKTSLNARVTGTLERDGYRVENLVYESLPNFFVTANVYVPTGTGPFPAVLGVAGHSDSGKAISTYQHVWISLAKRGFLVLAFDPPGQGERSEYFDPGTGKSKVGIGTREHMMAGLQCLLTGTTFARYEIADGVRAIDYLLTRPDVDSKRIAVAGNSGGGTQAAYLAVVEPRLAAAVTSCYITSWETLWDGPGPQDSEQVFPNFLHDGLDFGDFLVSFAPRPILMTTAVRDFFPIAGARATYAEAERLFRVADAPGRAGYFEYDDGHGWSQPRREAAYRWLSKWLQDREDEGREPPHATEDEKLLNVTPTGQVATSFGGETVQSLNWALARKTHANRSALRAKAPELRQLIRNRLRMGSVTLAPDAEESGSVEVNGIGVGKLRLRTDRDARVPALLILPPSEKPFGAVIWIDEAGKSAAMHDLLGIVNAGEAVLAVDVRGCGESAVVPSAKGGYSAEYARAMRAVLVGKTLTGLQVTDALAAFEYLRGLPRVDARRIRIAGRGTGGVVARIAGALEPRIAAVSAERSLTSWMEMARSRIHRVPASLVVPGVLRDFDLPDLARLIAPRPLTISAPIDAEGLPTG